MKTAVKLSAIFLAVLTAFSFCACKKANVHQHVYAEQWYYDDTYHWQVPICGDTDEIGNRSKHNFINGVCHLCGYSKNAPEEEYLDVVYTSSIGGAVEGEKTQRVRRGSDALPVTAVPSPGFMFVMWDDGEIDAERHDLKVDHPINTQALFEPDPDDPAIDDDENFGNDHPDDPEADNEKKGTSEAYNGLIYTEIRTLTTDEITGYSVKIDPMNIKNSYNIPEEHNDYPVLQIEDNAFSGYGVNSVIIPESVTKVGNQAFSNCGSLREISIPDSVLDVGVQAFMNCGSLTTVKLSAAMEGVWYKMFYNCRNLQKMEFPDSIKSIGRYAFCNCTSLTELKFGKGINNCGAKAFQNCKNLKKVDVSDMTAWCETTFDFFMYALRSTFESNPLFYAKNLYLNGTLVTDLEIPDGTAKISSYAFYGCTSLTSVKVPGSVKIVDSLAFTDCANLKSIEFAEGLVSIDYAVFDGCDELTTAKFPDTLESLGHDLFFGCHKLTDVTFGKGLKTIDYALFIGCKLLSKVDYRGTVEQWKAIDISLNWMSDCSPNFAVRCLESKKNVNYVQKEVVENYTRFFRYVEVSVTDWTTEDQ